MEQAQQNTAQELTAQAIPQQAVEDACFHSLGLIGRTQQRPAHCRQDCPGSPVAF